MCAICHTPTNDLGHWLVLSGLRSVPGVMFGTFSVCCYTWREESVLFEQLHDERASLVEDASQGWEASRAARGLGRPRGTHVSLYQLSCAKHCPRKRLKLKLTHPGISPHDKKTFLQKAGWCWKGNFCMTLSFVDKCKFKLYKYRDCKEKFSVFTVEVWSRARPRKKPTTPTNWFNWKPYWRLSAMAIRSQGGLRFSTGIRVFWWP